MYAWAIVNVVGPRVTEKLTEMQKRKVNGLWNTGQDQI